MRSRAVREGSAGLLVLLGLGLLTGGILWLRGGTLGNQPYTLKVELADTLGLDAGSPVRFRGVKVGQVTQVIATTGGVMVTAEISSPELLIPRGTLVSTTQSGFIGQVTLDFKAPAALSARAFGENLSPFEPNCNPQIIFCEGDQIQGDTGLSFDQLIQATTLLATELGNADLKGTLKNLSTAAVSINQLSKTSQGTLRQVSRAAVSLTQLSGNANEQLSNVGTAAKSVTKAANQVGQVGNQVGQVGQQFSTTAQRLTATAEQVNDLIQANRGRLVVTLDNLQTTSQDLKIAVQNLGPVIGRLQQSQLLENLEQLAANGAEASENLKALTSPADDPTILIRLNQTLDAARATFQNTQKITTDLERLTGDPKFLENLIRLVNGLSKLVSSSQVLEQQLLVGQTPSRPEISSMP